MTKWISVTEGLPSHSTDVLCVVRFGASIRQTVAGYFPLSGKSDSRLAWFEFSDPDKELNVTHWMELPKYYDQYQFE